MDFCHAWYITTTMSKIAIFIKFNMIESPKFTVAQSDDEFKKASSMKGFEEKECWCVAWAHPYGNEPSRCWVCNHELFTQLCDCHMCTIYREHRLERDCNCYQCMHFVQLDKDAKH